jgi:DNA-binding transcriptional LysR family regulator
MLNPGRLQMLRELSRRGTIAAASASLHLTPSAVSQQLLLLEKEVGLELLRRTGRRVTLTPAADALLVHADTILRAIENAESDLAGLRGEASGELPFSAFPTVARALMPQVLATLEEELPNVFLRMTDIDDAKALKSLRDGEIDLALVDSYNTFPIDTAGDDLRFEELMVDPVYALLPVEHSLADPERARIDLQELRPERWITDSTESSLHQAVLRAIPGDDFEPNVKVECRDFSVIVALVASGTGVAILPGLALTGAQGVVYKPLRPHIERQILVATRANANRRPAIAAMLSELRRQATLLSEPGATDRASEPG